MKSSRKSTFRLRFPTKKSAENISRLPYISLLYTSIVLNVSVILGILSLKMFIPPEVPLFYGLPEGQAQVASREELIIPSMVSLMVTLINISLASLLQNEFLKRSLIIVSLVIALLSLITTFEIVLLVGSF